MTRINLVPPQLLTDQHLLAENKEINQLAGQMLKSLRSPNFSYNELPMYYTLGTGHVRFWYRYGAFIRDRYDLVYTECKKRGFNVVYNFNDVWKSYDKWYNHDFTPSESQMQISIDRIKSKIEAKPDYYRYYGKPIDVQSYYWALKIFQPKWIKEKRTN